MADDKLAELLRTQKSLTEWLEDIKHKDADAIRREDNDKRERLKVLGGTISLPFDQPTQFEASQLANRDANVMEYLKEHGDELCALRLMPKEDGLPKLRMRGKTVKGAYEWFGQQDIDADKYRADFIPHAEDASWATIFVVNKHGIQGEIIRGGHHQLTQGFHEDNTPHIFKYDFKDWTVEPEDAEVLEHLKSLATYLFVPDEAKQNRLKEELGATFSNDYIEGYFETSNSQEFGTWFIDYSQSLGKMYEDMVVQTGSKGSGIVKGQVGSPGKVTGPVQVVDPADISADFPAGAVLVCAVTTPDYVPLMQKAIAIVTDQGGILSHAAIVARELKKPCIVGTGNATQILKNGQNISVDADLGTVDLKSS
jgi:phosphoenolpyruvate synthase/pyruvate phosphate dikinase